MKTPILIIAAGGSRRLGHPKQLVKFRDKTLLELSVSAASDSGADIIFVVVGSNAELIKNSHLQLKVNWVLNENWEMGMGTSISTGLSKIQEMYPEVNEVIIQLCDQPFIQADNIYQLYSKAYSTTKNIVASKYESGQTGPPMLFKKHYFKVLNSLDQDLGARRIVMKNSDDVEYVYFEKGDVDIDTEEDLDTLQS